MSSTAGRRTASAVLGLAVLASLLLALGAATGRLQTAAVLTGSMAPYAPAGSAVVTVPVPSSGVRPGDVVTLRAPAPWDSVVTHRVVSAQTRDGAVVLMTKGDRNDGVDPWQAVVREPQVHRVVLVVPHLGSALTALSGDTAERVRRVAVWALAVGWLVHTWRPARPALATRAGLRSPFFDVSHLPAH